MLELLGYDLFNYLDNLIYGFQLKQSNKSEKWNNRDFRKFIEINIITSEILSKAKNYICQVIIIIDLMFWCEKLLNIVYNAP